MHFHLPALSLLIEFRTYFQDLISDSAVFSQRGTCFACKEEEKIFAGQGPGFGHRQ
jgi:hypothetical protein